MFKKCVILAFLIGCAAPTQQEPPMLHVDPPKQLPKSVVRAMDTEQDGRRVSQDDWSFVVPYSFLQVQSEYLIYRTADHMMTLCFYNEEYIGSLALYTQNFIDGLHSKGATLIDSDAVNSNTMKFTLSIEGQWDISYLIAHNDRIYNLNCAISNKSEDVKHDSKVCEDIFKSVEFNK